MAAGLAAFALGTDIGGSVRVPASLCGVVGFKPTYDLLSTSGVIPFSWSLDHVGIVSRTAADAAVILEALVGHSVGAYTEDVKNLRLGVPRPFFFEDLDPQIEAAVIKALGTCRSLGAEIVDIEIPGMDETRTVSLLIQLPEMLSYHSRYLPEKKELYCEDLRTGMALGQFILAEHYVLAKRMKEQYRRQMAEIFRKVDLISTPTCPVIAPKIGTSRVTTARREEPVGNAITRFTSFFNLVGLPALSLPCGIHSAGLPIGIQLVGRHYEDRTILGFARRLEAALEVERPPSPFIQ